MMDLSSSQSEKVHIKPTAIKDHKKNALEYVKTF